MQEVIDFGKMTWSDKLQNIHLVKRALKDQDSKILFDARVDYMIDRNEERYFEKLKTLSSKWSCFELLDKDVEHTKKIIVFGCGEYGKKNKKILETCGLVPECFCDTNYYGAVVEGIPVISVQQMINKYGKEALIIIGSVTYKGEMVDILHKFNYPSNKIIEPKHMGVLWGMTGRQYFDYFSCGEQEIYVDAGTYDGSTVMDFVSWTNGKYKKIFACEPFPQMCKLAEETFKIGQVLNIVVSQCAVWDKDEELQFFEDGAGSRVNSHGTMVVDGRTIDRIVANERVTYIKMDIEGSELRALKGAENTIRKWKPKLAVCIYHKPYDIVELALYILSLVPEYKLGIRHYALNMCETVLYANV